MDNTSEFILIKPIDSSIELQILKDVDKITVFHNLKNNIIFEAKELKSGFKQIIELENLNFKIDQTIMAVLKVLNQEFESIYNFTPKTENLPS